jgi:hypothetical protein
MLIHRFYSFLLFEAMLLSPALSQAQDGPIVAPKLPSPASRALLAPSAKPVDSSALYSFNLSDNAELIYRVLDAEGKPAGELRQRVVKVSSGELEEKKKQKVPEYTTSLKSGCYDKKNGLVRLQDLTFRCRRDTSFTDGLAELPTDALRAFRNRKLGYTPLPLAWPNQPTAGSTLPSGGVSVQVSSSMVNIATVSVHLRNRRVVSGPTPLTTPAGTFSCYKVEASRESATVPRPDMAMRSSVKQVDFYTPGVGIIRTEVYNKKGKLEQVRELTARNVNAQ